MSALQRDEELAAIIADEVCFHVGSMTPHSNVCGVQEANTLLLSHSRPGSKGTISRLIHSNKIDDQDKGHAFSRSISYVLSGTPGYAELYMPELEAIFIRDLTGQLFQARLGQSVGCYGARKAIVNYWFNAGNRPERSRIYQCDPLVKWLRAGGWKKSRITEIPPILNPNSGNIIVGFSISTELAQ